MDFSFILTSIAPVFNLESLMFITIGAIGGVLVGAIPGLTATMTVALLIPFTYELALLPSLGMLFGIFYGAMYGGAITAILMRTPGTPASAATVIDGYPMGQKGEAGRALAISLFSSLVGGITGALVMTFLSPFVSRIALRFGPAEFFTLAIFGLSVIISISGKSLVKGLISGFFGLLIATVGMDKTCAYLRFTRMVGFYEGIPFIPALIGLFAISEVFSKIEMILHKMKKISCKISGVLPSLSDIKLITPTVIKGSLIGTFIGIVPGAGGDIAAFVSYSEAKRSSKHPEKFGSGAPEGVAAAECANNACAAGGMIPTLSLGVPGDSVAAVLMGAFILKGIQPGPMMYVNHMDIVYAVFASMFLATIAFFIVGMCGVKLFAKVISVEQTYLIPSILILSLVGSYAINRSMFDVFFCLAMGLVGYLFMKYEFPLSPIVLALILGPMSESNLRRFMQIDDGQFWRIFTKPICVILISLAFLSMFAAVRNQIKTAKRIAEQESKQKSEEE